MVENNQPVFMEIKKGREQKGEKKKDEEQGTNSITICKEGLYEFRSFSRNDGELHCVYSVTAQDVMKLHCRVL